MSNPYMISYISSNENVSRQDKYYLMSAQSKIIFLNREYNGSLLIKLNLYWDELQFQTGYFS